jgi:hypothetical protein
MTRRTGEERYVVVRSSVGPVVPAVLLLLSLASSLAAWPIGLAATAPLWIGAFVALLAATDSVLDGAERVLVHKHRLGLRRPRSVSVEDAIAVRVERRTIQGSKHNTTVYTVSLTRHGAAPTTLASVDTVTNARRLAERIGTSLHIGMEDATTGTLVVRDAGTLDEPLRDRIRRQSPSASTSRGRRGRLEPVQGEGTGYRLPMSGLDSLAANALIMLSVIPSIAGVNVALSEGDVWLLSSVLAASVCVVAFALALMRVRPIVAIGPRGLVVTSGILPGLTERLPLDELEELFIVSDRLRPERHHIMARSDRRSVKMGHDLSADEAEFLHDQLSTLIRDSSDTP